jgi:hypothetical protein
MSAPSAQDNSFHVSSAAPVWNAVGLAVVTIDEDDAVPVNVNT